MKMAVSGATSLGIGWHNPHWDFRRLGALAQNGPAYGSDLIIGDGEPIRAEQGATLHIRLTENSPVRQIEREGDHFVWYVLPDDARRFRELARGLEATGKPAHQYLESDEPLGPVLVLSKDEYGEAALRAIASG